jgi:hypothetical protein
MLKGRITTTPLSEIVGVQKPIDEELLQLAHALDK